MLPATTVVLIALAVITAIATALVVAGLRARGRCRECGAPIDPAARFCPHCGRAIR